MKVIVSPQFKKKIKKLPKQDKEALDQEIYRIINNPSVGEEKKQDLAGVYVYKFKINRQEVLISYRFSEVALNLLTFGSHENFIKGTSINLPHP